MRRLPVKQHCLQGICLWFTPFGYFSDAENQDLLLQLGRLLAGGGVLMMDYLHADLVARTLVPEDSLERGTVRVHSLRTIEGDRLLKRMLLTRLETGETREALESVRLYQPAELQDLADRAGLRIRRVMGGYDGAPFSAESPRWIGIFEKVPGGV
jgi:hypothetical protein